MLNQKLHPTQNRWISDVEMKNVTDSYADWPASLYTAMFRPSEFLLTRNGNVTCLSGLACPALRSGSSQRAFRRRTVKSSRNAGHLKRPMISPFSYFPALDKRCRRSTTTTCRSLRARQRQKRETEKHIRHVVYNAARSVAFEHNGAKAIAREKTQRKFHCPFRWWPFNYLFLALPKFWRPQQLTRALKPTKTLFNFLDHYNFLSNYMIVVLTPLYFRLLITSGVSFYFSHVNTNHVMISYLVSF